MWLIEFQARCPASVSELSTASPAQAASLVEAALSVALLELCGEVEVESVRVRLVDDGASGAVASASRQPAARIAR